MDNKAIEKFIRKQRVAFICSIYKEGFPNVKAMLKPRKMDGLHYFYFSTNTASMRVKQYMNNPNACIYFYHKGLIKYVGVMLKGKMEVLTDQETKDMIWRKGDTMMICENLAAARLNTGVYYKLRNIVIINVDE